MNNLRDWAELIFQIRIPIDIGESFGMNSLWNLYRFVFIIGFSLLISVNWIISARKFWLYLGIAIFIVGIIWLILTINDLDPDAIVITFGALSISFPFDGIYFARGVKDLAKKTSLRFVIILVTIGVGISLVIFLINNVLATILYLSIVIYFTAQGFYNRLNIREVLIPVRLLSVLVVVAAMIVTIVSSIEPKQIIYFYNQIPKGFQHWSN